MPGRIPVYLWKKNLLESLAKNFWRNPRKKSWKNFFWNLKENVWTKLWSRFWRNSFRNVYKNHVRASIAILEGISFGIPELIPGWIVDWIFNFRELVLRWVSWKMSLKTPEEDSRKIPGGVPETISGESPGKRVQIYTRKGMRSKDAWRNIWRNSCWNHWGKSSLNLFL